MARKKNITTSNSNKNVKQAFEARLNRRIAANPSIYYKRNKLRKLSAEEKYQMLAQEWIFHPSSWYMREANAYDD